MNDVAAPPICNLQRDLPAAEYFAVEAMSASGAKKMLRSPQHYRLDRDTPSVPTPQMQFGTAVHCGVLEPARFADAVACEPEINKRTKNGQAQWAEFSAANAGKIILGSDDHARALACIEAIRAHPAAAYLLEGAEIESSLFWTDGKYQVPCKARLDGRNHGGIVDLKTTADASPEAFARQAANLLYHVQAAHYISAAEHVLNESPAFFAFIVAEADPPHGVACYAMPGNAILAGARLMDIALERYAAALAAGDWPGYPTTIDALPFPKWATRFDL